MVFVVLAMMQKLLLTGGPRRDVAPALAARTVASAPPVADDQRQAVSHAGSNGRLAGTPSIEMTCASERAKRDDLCDRRLFQSERPWLNLKDFVQRRPAAVMRA
jgi:hypothetical protein